MGNFSRWQTDDISFFAQETGFDIMQIVSNGDNLHEMSNPVFWGKYFNMSSADFFYTEC